jgi:acyl carrier protein
LPESLAHGMEPYRIHPALLDSCWQLLPAALPADGGENACLPIGLERFTLFAVPPEKLWSHTVLRPVSWSGWEAFSGDIWLYDDNDRMVAEIVGLQLGRITADAIVGSLPRTQHGSSTSRKSAAAHSEVSLQLKTASPARRRDILIAHLRSQTGSILGFDHSREIELDQGLFDMGMDSLMAVELKGRLERSLGVPLPSTLTFNYPTIRTLVEYLLSDALGFDFAPAPEKADPIPSPVKVVSFDDRSEDLSEDELTLLLQKKLEQIN